VRALAVSSRMLARMKHAGEQTDVTVTFEATVPRTAPYAHNQ